MMLFFPTRRPLVEYSVDNASNDESDQPNRLNRSFARILEQEHPSPHNRYANCCADICVSNPVHNRAPKKRRQLISFTIAQNQVEDHRSRTKGASKVAIGQRAALDTAPRPSHR